MTPAGSLIRKAHNQLSRMLAEAKLWQIGRSAPNERPRVLFFPSGNREGASLLRAYNIANALCSHGWVAAAVPGTANLSGRARIVRRFRPDLLVFQQCRHPLNDGELAFGLPYVVDTDDADFHLEIPGLAERLERTVRGARGVIAGSRYIRDYHKRLNRDIAVIWTGERDRDQSWPRHADREAKGPPIVAWAQARPLDYTRELEFVADLDRHLRATGSRHRLRLHGVDSEAERMELASRFSPDCLLELVPTLEYDRFVASLLDVSVGLCPLAPQSEFSRGKSFGKILAYLAAGVPVIASDAGDHALFFNADAGIVSNEPLVWQQALQALLAEPQMRDQMAERAGALLHERLSLDTAAALTDKFLRKLIDFQSANGRRASGGEA